MDLAELRRKCRDGSYSGPTSGHAVGHVQANMVILPRADADEFREFCLANPKPCPILEELAPGDPVPRNTAPGADVRTDLPRYRVFRNGEPVDEPDDISDLWRDDLVTFLLGCSFIAEEALFEAGLTLAHIGKTGTGFVPMYRTGVQTDRVGRFHGPMVVSMRPFLPADADRAEEITSHFPMAHGGPIHRGDPAAIGIRDIDNPEFGAAVTILDGQIPIFWACGVTPQAAIQLAKPSLCITHAPGAMLITDIPDQGPGN